MSRTSKLYAAKGLTRPTTYTPIMAQKKEKVLPSFSRTAKLYAQKGLTRPTTTTPIMQSTSLNTTRLKPVESIATTNSQVSIGPVNRFNSGPTAMEHDQSSNYKAPAKYTYESVQDRINNYQTDFDKIVKRYGAKQDKDGTWTFYTQKGLDAANRLQQEMEAALTDYNGYYSSADYVKKLANESAKTKAATESELAEAREQVEKAQSKLSAYEGMYMGSLDMPNIKPEHERLQAEVSTALKRKNALEAQLETANYTLKYNDKIVDKTYEDTFKGQFNANYRAGRLSQDSAKAWNDYVQHPTAENKAKAENIDTLLRQFQTQNKEALDDENVVVSWITQDLAGHLPQEVDQTVAKVIGGLAGALIAGGSGFKVGSTIGSGVQSYNTMQGAAYKALIEAGVDEKVALEAAKDEAFISAVIEMGDTAMDWLLFPIKGGAKKVVGKLPSAVTKVAEALSKIKNLPAPLKAGLGYLANIPQEGGEEGSQQIVSIANIERAKRGESGLFNLLGESLSTGKEVVSDLFSGKSTDYTEQVKEAAASGMKIAAMTGATQTVLSQGVNYAINTVANRLNQQAQVVQQVNPDATVLDAATTLFVQQGMKLKTAQIRADIIRRLMEGDETVTNLEINKLEPTHKTTQQIFTQLTGVQFPEGKLTTKQLHEIYRSASTVAQAANNAVLEANEGQNKTALNIAEPAKEINGVPVEFLEGIEYGAWSSDTFEQNASYDGVNFLYEKFPGAPFDEWSRNAYQAYLQAVKGIPAAKQTVQAPQTQAAVQTSGDAQAANISAVLSSKRDGENGWGAKYGTAQKALIDAVKQVDSDLLSALAQEINENAGKKQANAPIARAVIAVQEDVRQDTITPMQGAEILSQAYKSGGVQGLTALYNPNTGNLYDEVLEKAEQGAYNGAKKNTEVEAHAGEGAEGVLLHGSSQRHDSKSTGGQTGQLEESAGRDPSREEAGNRPRDKEASALSFGPEISTAELGISVGSRRKTVRKVKSGQTESMKKAKAEARKHGLKVVFFSGSMQMKNGDLARGCIEKGVVYVRVDHPDFTADQIVRHEIGHHLIDSGEISMDKVLERLHQIYTDEQLDEFVEKYLNAYAGTEMDGDEAFMEIICDALGGMNIFDGSELAAEWESFLNNVNFASATLDPGTMKALNDGRRIEMQDLSKQDRIAAHHRSGELDYDAMGRLYKVDPAQHISQRTYESVGSVSINAFQFDHPVLHPYIAQAAKALISDASGSIENGAHLKTERTMQGKKTTLQIETTHLLDMAMAEGLSRNEIIAVANQLIEGGGQENNAAAKRMELVLDEYLTEGYYDATEGYIPPNEEYIEARKKIPGYQERVREQLPLSRETKFSREATENGKDLEQVYGEAKSRYGQTTGEAGNRSRVQSEGGQSEGRNEHTGGKSDTGAERSNRSGVQRTRVPARGGLSHSFGKEPTMAWAKKGLVDARVGSVAYNEQQIADEYRIPSFVVKDSVWRANGKKAPAFAAGGQIYYKEHLSGRYQDMLTYHEMNHVMRRLKFQPYLDFLKRVPDMLAETDAAKQLLKRVENHVVQQGRGTTKDDRFYDELNAMVYGHIASGKVSEFVIPFDEVFTDFFSYAAEIADIHEQFKAYQQARIPAPYNSTQNNESTHATGEDAFSLPKFSRETSRQRDNEYMAAVENGDIITAQRMVDEAAKAAGYGTKLYHGTKDFGFTKFNPKFSDDKISLFVSSSVDVAQTYSGTYDIKPVSTKPKHYRADKLTDAQIRDGLSSWKKFERVSGVQEVQQCVNEALVDRWNALVKQVENRNKLVDTLRESGFDKEEYFTIPAAYNRLMSGVSFLGFTPARLAEVAQMFTEEQLETEWGKTAPGLSTAKAIGNLAALAQEESAYVARNTVGNAVLVISEEMAAEQAAIALNARESNGNYALYGKTDGMFVIDGKGANWNHIPFRHAGKEFASTRDIVAWAHEHGYTGVRFKNIVDNSAFGRSAGASDVYAFFDGKQLKSADPVTYNRLGKVIPLSKRFNEKKNDIRFSRERPVEQVGNLVALHNLNAGKLNKVLDLGGFPMPSIAVTRTDIPHTNFGDITLVMNKSTIDPKANRKNTVYSADAWTPTVPPVSYKPSEKRLREIKKTVYDLVGGHEVISALDHIAFDADNISRALDRYDGDLATGYRDNNTLRYAFLKDSGADIELPVEEADLDGFHMYSNAAVRYFVGKLVDGLRTVDMYQNMGASALLKDNELKEAVADVRNWERLQNFEPGTKAYQVLVEHPQFKAEDVSFSEINSLLSASRRYFNGGTKQTINRSEASKLLRQYIADNGLQEQYEAWLAELFDGVVEKTGIYNNKDIFTPSGNRRSFEQLHMPVTLENIVKAMASQNNGNTKNVAGFNGVKTLRAGMAKRFKSITEMHNLEERLQNLTEEEFEAIHDQLSERMFAIINRIIETGPKSSGNSFMRMDSVGEMMMEIAESGNYSLDNIVNTYKKYQYNVGTDLANDVKVLLFDVAQMPTNMFEAKPERVVGFDEVLAAIVPDDTDQNLITRLKDAGVMSVVTYAKGDDTDRLAKANSMPEAFFSREPMRKEDQATAYAELQEWAKRWTELQEQTKEGNFHGAQLAGQMAQGRKMAPQIRKAEEKLKAEKEKARAAAKQAREDKMKALADQDLAWNIHHTAEIRAERQQGKEKLAEQRRELNAEKRKAVSETKEIERATAAAHREADTVMMKAKAAERLRRNDERWKQKADENRNRWNLKRKAAAKALSDSKKVAEKRNAHETEQGMVNTIRKAPGDKKYVERLQESATNLRTLGRAAYRNFVSRTADIEVFGRRQVSGIRADTLVNIVGATPTTIEHIFKSGLVDRNGNRIGDSMKEVFLVMDKRGRVDEERQALLQDYMLHLHNTDRMGIEDKALDQLRAYEVENPWLLEMDPKEFALLVGMTETEVKKTGKQEAQKRAIEYAKLLDNYNTAENKPIFPDEDDNPVTAKTSRGIVEKYLQENPWLEEKANGIYEWWDLFMKTWAIGDSLTQSQYDAMREMYPHYVPTYRVQDKTGAAVSVAVTGARPGQAVKRATGGLSQVMNIEDGFSQLVSKIVKLNRVNEFYKNIVDTAMLDESGDFWDMAVFDWDSVAKKDVPLLRPDFADQAEDADAVGLEKTEHGDYRLSAWYDGKLYSCFLSEDMFKAISDIAGKTNSDLERILLKAGNTLTGAMKTAITGINPTFALRNISRDIPTAIVNSISGFAFPKYWAKALNEMRKNSDRWQQFQALGGTHAEYYNQEQGFANAMAERRGAGAKVVGALGWFNEVTEAQTRFAEYLATIDRLGDTYENRLLGIKNSAEVTVDFSRKGKYGKVINAWVPYWNPAVQGIDKTIRSVIESKDGSAIWRKAVVTIGRAAVINVLAEAVLYAVLKALGRYDDWEELDDRTKDTYYCIPLPTEHKFLKIPRNREWGAILGAPIQRILEYANGRENPFENYVQTALQPNFMAGNIVPVWDGEKWSSDMIIVSQALDLAQNKNFYGSSIVPYAYQQGSVTEQYDSETSILGRALGELLNFSPMQIDYLISDYFGDFGDLFINATSEATWAGDNTVVDLAQSVLDMVTDPFLTNSQYSNRSVSKYYDTLDELEKVVQDKKNQMGSDAYKNTVEYQTQTALNKLYGNTISELNKEVRNLPDGEEKDALKEQIATIAAAALEYYDQCMSGEIANPVLDATYSTVSDHISDELIRLDGFADDYAFEPTYSPSKTYTDPRRKTREYNLDEEQRDYLKKLFLVEYDKQVTELLNSSKYKNLSDEKKAEKIAEVRSDAIEAAKEQFFDWLEETGVRSTKKD